jgi:hypothetical protein
MSEPTLKLQRNADELLQEFPFTEPDFDAQAKAIEARLKGSPGGVMFDDYLKVPELAAAPGEPAAPSSVRAAPAPKSNFAEMARKSVQKKDDSVEIAKDLLAATAQSRRPSAEMVERVRAAGRAPATSTPLPVSEPANEDAQRNSGVVARDATTVRPAPPPSSINRGTVIGIVGVAVGLAACVALFLKSGSQSDNQTTAALAAEKAADAPAAAAPKSATPTAAAPKANDGVVSPEALAAAPMPEATKAVGAAKAAAAPGAGPNTAPAMKAAPPASVGAKQEAVVLEEDAAPQQAAPQQAAPAAKPEPEPQLKPAEGNTGSVPISPSAGAISTALSSVRGGAQACLAGQSDPVTAVVTFGADGHVLRVSAPGPSGACIQAALSKAHIAPFAKESFTATTTIRPP